MLSYHLVLVTLYHGLQLVLSKRIIFGDTKYHNQCSTLSMVLSVTCCLELLCAMTFTMDLIFLPTKVKLVAWTSYNINIFIW